MTVDEVMAELKRLGSAQTIKTFARHGAPVDKMYGVKVGDLKGLQKKIKKDHQLSLDLFDTGNSDAMYLASMITDHTKLTKPVLERWAKQAPWYMISEYSVAWAAAESAHGWALANKWINAKDAKLKSTGWATLSSLVSITPDEELDLPALIKLMERVRDEIDDAPERVKYTMNGFLISAGSYVKDLTSLAKSLAKEIGTVEVDMGDTSCKVPSAVDYIKKIETAKRIGNKRKSAYC